MLQYAGTDEILAMTPEDQKLYAEITYSWMITRLNKIKRSHNIDFLFCGVVVGVVCAASATRDNGDKARCHYACN